MNKQKHQQNQEETLDITVNKANSDTLQTESQPDATKPQEHGRSMTEMLGVLAIIGVLSIGGVQGYRYAMNKYQANEVVNELNLLNAQLAIFMNSNHEDEAIMSLGDPYDTTETTKTGGYAFSYGCGQDPTSTTPCDLDETGYYMTLNGVPEDICKSVSQMTANMMNLVEQRVNNMTDYDGVLCHDNNNVMTFLFDANEGGSFDNGNGGEVTNAGNQGEGIPDYEATYIPDNDVTDTYTPDYEATDTNPEATETIPEETQTPFITTTLHDECYWSDWMNRGKRPNLIEAGVEYELLGGICHSSEYVADIQCRAASFPYTPLDEIGQKITCNTNIGLYCINSEQKPGGATPTADCLDYEIKVYCCPGKDMPPRENKCANSECHTNSDCSSDEYCDITCYNEHNFCTTDDPQQFGGTCRKTENDLNTNSTPPTCYNSNRPMTWWAAQNFCERFNKKIGSYANCNVDASTINWLDWIRPYTNGCYSDGHGMGDRYFLYDKRYVFCENEYNYW